MFRYSTSTTSFLLVVDHFEGARSLAHAARRGELGAVDAQCEALGAALERLTGARKRLVEELREKD